MSKNIPVRLAYECIEVDGCDKAKSPIIFLHGMTQCKELWHDLPRTIGQATKRKIIIVDARNHGASERTDVFNFDVNVDDLLHLMDQINVQKAILVGHSMGGITSIKTSLRAPERVEKIVVEDMSVSQLTPKIVKMVQEYVGLTQEALDSIPDSVKDLDEAAKLYVEHIFKRLPPEGDNLTNTKNPESVRKFVIMKRNADGKFSVNYNNQAIIKALNDPQNLMSDPSGVFEGPACFIYGKLSPFITDGEECVIKKHFPNAKLVGIEGATHTVHVDRPKEFTEALLSFLQN